MFIILTGKATRHVNFLINRMIYTYEHYFEMIIKILHFNWMVTKPLHKITNYYYYFKYDTEDSL